MRVIASRAFAQMFYAKTFADIFKNIWQDCAQLENLRLLHFKRCFTVVDFLGALGCGRKIFLNF